LKNLEGNDQAVKEAREKGVFSFRDNIEKTINQNLLLEKE